MMADEQSRRTFPVFASRDQAPVTCTIVPTPRGTQAPRGHRLEWSPRHNIDERVLLLYVPGHNPVVIATLTTLFLVQNPRSAVEVDWPAVFKAFPHLWSRR